MQNNDTTHGDIALDLPERYHVIAELGQGGMSRVYRAVDDLLQKEVAIKILHSDAQTNNRNLVGFQREAKITAQFKHQNIVSILDFGLTKAGLPYLVMDYIAGESLAEVLSRSGRVSIADSMPLIFEILDAVKYAHGQGVLHRDLKPGNILIANNPDDNAVVKLIDFGIARFADPGQQQDTGSGGIHGTPAYMSPEQARGKNIDQRSEVYSLGCVLFSIWTACPPFAGDTAMEVLNQHCEKNPPRLADMSTSNLKSADNAFPEELERLISRCLAKDPNERFQSVDELEKELRKVEEAYPIGTTADSGTLALSENKTASIQPPSSRPNLLMPASIMLVVVITAGLVFFIANNPESQKNDSLSKISKQSAAVEETRFTPPLEDLELDRSWRYESEPGMRGRSLVCPEAHVLVDADLKDIGHLDNYQKLKLRNHKDFKGGALRFINNPNLVNLDIAESSLDEDGWKALTEMKAPLTNLDLGQCSTFKGSDLKRLLKLKTLVDIAVPLENISPADAAILSTHRNLQAIMLCGKCTLNPDVLREFAKLKNLKILNLDQTLLKPEDLKPLQERTSLLEALGLNAIDVTPELMHKVAELPIRRLSLNSCKTLNIRGLMALARSGSIEDISVTSCPNITPSDYTTAQKGLAPKIIRCTFSSKSGLSKIPLDAEG